MSVLGLLQLHSHVRVLVGLFEVFSQSSRFIKRWQQQFQNYLLTYLCAKVPEGVASKGFLASVFLPLSVSLPPSTPL